MDIAFTISVILFYLSVALLPFSLLGLLTVYHWIKPAKHPVEKSNIINSIRLWWFALTRREKFVNVFSWLKNDEWENIKDVHL